VKENKDINITKTFPFKKDLSWASNLFFIGIGGIGMSSLARYFSINGKNVAGYDRVTTKITKDLEEVGIKIHFKDEISNIPNQFLDKENTLIVYTPAIPNTHKEFNYFKKSGFVILKRAEILGVITKETYCFAVAGTHGKTTISTILGHILIESGIDATSFLGGIATNYNSNLILGGDKITVVEADEYDRSFLKLSPNMACINSIDADHLDIYGEASELEKSFQEFTNKVSDKLIIKYGLPFHGITFGLEDKANYQAKNVRIEGGFSVFDIETSTEFIKDVKFQMFGNHNILNALAAFTMAKIYGVSAEKLKNALATFKGIERRFNIKINTDNLVLIDDYAHHPTEINAVFDTLTQMYPYKKKMVIFQPHLFTRTRDFADEFATSLAQFDTIYVLDIYPARELPIKGISSDWLVDKIKKTNKEVALINFNAKSIIEKITSQENIVVAMLGAGDIGNLIKQVCNSIELKIPTIYK
jgi:UDP-N-acetylmuramate--alanine ligase